jgi:hypothetical protein
VTPREVEEYSALRATIRERGSLRVVLFMIAVIAWAAATIATASLAALPVATLLPLFVLAAGFESVFAVHTGVERVGRYLQVFYDEEGSRDWERTAMAYGRVFPGGGSDALFSTYFYVATLLNFVPVLLAEPVRLEVAVVGAGHLLFIVRIFAAHRASGRQRALDLERFERLKQAGGASATGGAGGPG